MGAVIDVAQFWQLTGLVIFGNGRIFTISWPAGEIWGTVVSTALVVGSLGAGSQGFPLASRSVRRLLKFPACSAAVGTVAVRALPRSSRFHSWLQKKNSLSFMIGPPALYPKSLRRNLSFLMPFRLLKKSVAFSKSFRP